MGKNFHLQTEKRAKKSDLIYQMSKAGVEIGAILQIPCPVYLRSVLELATLMSICADLQLLMPAISTQRVQSACICHERSESHMPEMDFKYNSQQSCWPQTSCGYVKVASSLWMWM